MRDTAIVENAGKAAVVAVTEEFVEHGKNIARMEGRPGIRQLVFPFPFEGLAEDKVRQIAEDRYAAFLAMIGAKR